MYDIPAILEHPHLREPLIRSVADDVPPSYLRSVKLKITARCNLKCVMCRYGRGWAPPELPTERWLDLLGQMQELGCRKVHFSGGEVLVRKDFEQLVARAADEGMKVTFTSNLTLLTKERAKALMRSKVSSISTSLDGATAKMHESVRGIPGSFRRTLHALDALQRERDRRGRRTRIRINFVMMRRNYADYPALLELVGPRGVSDVVPMPVDTKDDRLRPTKQMIRHYNAEIAPQVAELRARYGLPDLEERIWPFGRDAGAVRASVRGDYAADFYRDHICYAPYLHLFAAWDGKVYLCCMTNGRIDPLGDLSVQTVREVFLGAKFAEIRRQMLQQRLASCHQCDMYTDANRTLAAALPGPRGRSVPRALPVVY